MGRSPLAMPTTSTDALVLVDKPAGITSFDAVRAVGKALGTRRVGHTGTLDPFATGLLVMLSGRGTRLMRFVPGEPKVYLAEIAFGTETDTLDPTGTVIGTGPLPGEQVVRSALPGLTGRFDQVPPGYSARKVDGRRAYDLARAGETPVLAPARVQVDAWDVVAYAQGRLTARVSCGSGTYVRALARDLGHACGTCAHLVSLRRERCGPFGVEDADSWEAVRAGTVTAHPLPRALGSLPQVVLTPDEARRIGHGMAIAAQTDASPVVLLRDPGEILAIARFVEGRWHPEAVLPDA